MRKDMFKVIVGRPRRGSQMSYREVRAHEKNENRVRDCDSDPYIYKESMTRPYRAWDAHKELNENLAPLYRFLRSSCGKKWDDVFSEICENINTKSTVHQHVRDHVSQYVAISAIKVNEDGELFEDGIGRWRMKQNGVYSNFYVDPRDGTLCFNDRDSYKQYRRDRKEAYQAELRAHSQVFNDGCEFEKKDGIWYHVDIVLVKETIYENIRNRDGVLETVVAKRPGTYRSRGKQACSKVLKRYSLTNEAE